MDNTSLVPTNHYTSTSVPDLPVIFPAEISRSGYSILAAYTGFLTVFGILNNSLVIYLFIKFQNLRQPVNYFLLNLSISDLTISVCGSPLTFASNVAGRWIFGKTGCSIYAFIVMIGGFEQIVALAAISVHRCFLVVRPFTAKKMTANWALFFISLTWIYSFIMTVPPAFGWNEYVPEGAGTACAINWTDGKPGNTSYVIFIFIMVLVVPLLVIIVSYGLLVFAVKKIGESEAAQSTENKAEGRVTRMIIIMIALFLFAWSPYSALALYVSFSKDHTVSPIVATLPPFFAKACTIYNPILYFALNRQFRDAFYDLIGYHPAEEPETSGNRNTQRPGPTNRPPLGRTASSATVMSELPSAHHSKSTVPTGGATSSRAAIASRKVPVEPVERLNVPLPGQPMEMEDDPIRKKETSLNNLSVRASSADKNVETPNRSSTGPPPYSEVGQSHENKGYISGDGNVTTTNMTSSVVPTSGSGMPQVNV